MSGTAFYGQLGQPNLPSLTLSMTGNAKRVRKEENGRLLYLTCKAGDVGDADACHDTGHLSASLTPAGYLGASNWSLLLSSLRSERYGDPLTRGYCRLLMAVVDDFKHPYPPDCGSSHVVFRAVLRRASYLELREA